MDHLGSEISRIMDLLSFTFLLRFDLWLFLLFFSHLIWADWFVWILDHIISIMDWDKLVFSLIWIWIRTSSLANCGGCLWPDLKDFVVWIYVWIVGIDILWLVKEMRFQEESVWNKHNLLACNDLMMRFEKKWWEFVIRWDSGRNEEMPSYKWCKGTICNPNKGKPVRCNEMLL
jgi:hypothetical protein